MKIAVVGNGVIGSLCALGIKREVPGCSVSVFGDPHRPFSASRAAGAMVNVLAELESSQCLHATQKHFLDFGLTGSSGWQDFLLEFDAANRVKTASDTLVFLQRGSQDFELRNYRYVSSSAENLHRLSKVSSAELEDIFPMTHEKIEEAVFLRGEFALDTRELFFLLDQLTEALGISLISEPVVRVDPANTQVELRHSCISFDAIVVAAGAESSGLLPGVTQPTFSGAGTAFALNSSAQVSGSFLEQVVRTVNRGGAQCGLHTVPRQDRSLYLGAGNYVTRAIEPTHRLETISYLISRLEKELLGKDLVYQLKAIPVIGKRPKSLDGLPLLGPLKSGSRVFMATGTNRAGLTWAPAIAKAVTEWLSGEGLASIPDQWSPDRDLAQFGTAMDAVAYFVESRLGAATEHGLIAGSEIEGHRTELATVGWKLLENSQRVLGDNVVIHPDHWEVSASFSPEELRWRK